jgi:hypothetical protein
MALRKVQLSKAAPYSYSFGDGIVTLVQPPASGPRERARRIQVDAKQGSSPCQMKPAPSLFLVQANGDVEWHCG